MSDPNFDGKCGIPFRFETRGGYLRCMHDMGHSGEHSWKKYESQFTIAGSYIENNVEELIRRSYNEGELGARQVVERIAQDLDE